MATARPKQQARTAMREKRLYTSLCICLTLLYSVDVVFRLQPHALLLCFVVAGLQWVTEMIKTLTTSSIHVVSVLLVRPRPALATKLQAEILRNPLLWLRQHIGKQSYEHKEFGLALVRYAFLFSDAEIRHYVVICCSMVVFLSAVMCFAIVLCCEVLRCA